MRTIALMLAMAVPCLGRIGETREECLKRYGASHEETSDGRRLDFRVKGVQVLCFLNEGKVWAISFQKIPKMMTDPVPGTAADLFSPAQINLLLEANAQGSKWSKVEEEKDFSDTRYETSDGKLLARCGIVGLWIETRERVLAMRELRTDAAVDEAIKGF